LRIMTFNVRGDYNDGLNAWAKRSALNVATILEYAPDVIGFQEAQDVHLDVYRERLAGYALELGPQYNNDHPYSYNAVALREDVLEKAEAGGFWLSETPDETGFGWDAACVRSANWVRLRGAGGGGPGRARRRAFSVTRTSTTRERRPASRARGSSSPGWPKYGARARRSSSSATSTALLARSRSRPSSKPATSTSSMLRAGPAPTTPLPGRSTPSRASPRPRTAASTGS